MHDVVIEAHDDVAQCYLGYTTPHDKLPPLWQNYVAWVLQNYVHDFHRPTAGKLVDAHLAELGLIRITSGFPHHMIIQGPREALTAWILTHS